MTQAPAFLNSIPKTLPTQDKLDELRQRAEDARELQLNIENLEEQLKTQKAALQGLYEKELPDLMDKAGTDRIGIAPQGNKRGMDFRMRDFYRAIIAADWPAEKRNKGFETLEKYEAEGLIKTTVVARLDKGDIEKARELVEAAKLLDISPEVKLDVHWQTLTAWLRERCEAGQFLPQEDLDAIGGQVGRVVKPEERK